MEAGRQLGTYEILGPLGAGGMGEVYRARDANLGREVAIKILPSALADDPDRLARFEREARLLASMSHPNLATVHGFEEFDGVRFLVMELVAGETLGERIATGPLEAGDALALAAQLADGLEAAHEAGIVHRDLKPANVKVTPEDQVKILDFGLAKALDAPSGGTGGHHLSRSPTRAAATQEGWILGTAAYMSPEQARGKPVDRRADIWAFGCVLFEMLTGRPVFDGETATDVLAAIVREEPDWSELPAGTPRALRRLLRLCLQKDPRQRLRDIGDARIVLREMLGGRLEDMDPMVGSAEPRGPANRRGWLAMAGVALVALIVGALGTRLLSPDSAPGSGNSQVSRTTIALADDLRQPRLLQSPLAITRDGSLLAFVARSADGIIRLHLRPMNRFESRVVPGSEGARAPFFSPDGRWVGFYSRGALRKADVDGGEPLRLTATSSIAFGASWGTDGTIVYVPTINSGLWRIPADGGEPVQLTRPDFGVHGYAHTWPHHLTDGRSLVYGIWGGADADRILDLETGESRKLRAAGDAAGPRVLPSGHLIYADIRGSGQLLAAPLDMSRLELTGQAVPVLDDVRYMDSQSATPYLAVSENGTAVYASQEIGDASALWVDRTGAISTIRTGPEIIAGLRLSPDGRRAIFSDEQGGAWFLDLQRGTIDVALRGDDLFSIYPIWHPDGSRFTVASNDGGSWSMYLIDAAGDGEPILLLDRDYSQYPASYSADGRLLAYVESHPDTTLDVWVLPEGGEPVPVARTPADENMPAISPDGSLIAYISEESGRRQVYVQRFPGSERIDVSVQEGEQPVWSRDGGELFFRRGDRLFSVEVTAEPTLTASRPQIVFELPFEAGSGFGITPHYDVSADGSRFLVVSERPTREFRVISNWFGELSERVPTGR